MPQGLYTWSRTAAANSNADSSINFAEGMPPSAVNDSSRAVMARVAEFRDDISGALLTAGTSTHYTVSTNQNFASLALLDGKSITVVLHAFSGASPMLSVDGLAEKPLRCGLGIDASGGTFGFGIPYRFTYNNGAGQFTSDGAALQENVITAAKMADGAVTGAKIAANTITSANIAPGAIGAGAVAPSFIPVNTCMLNGTIAVLQGGGAMTINIKTLAGADPSATDPTTFIFRDVSASTGDYLVRTVTGPLSIVVPNLQTIGFVNGLPGRLWLLAIDNGGAVELAVFNAAAVAAGTPAGLTAIYPLQSFGIVTTAAIAGAPSAGVAYSTAARSAKPYVPLGYLSWEVGLGGVMGTAGNWNVLPSRIQIFQPGSSPLPGAVVQQAYLSNGTLATATATILPNDNTIPQSNEGDQFMQLAITPSSCANALLVTANGHFANTVAAGRIIAALFQDSNVNALAVTVAQPGTVSIAVKASIDYQLQAGTLAATTFKLRAGNQTGGGATTTFNGEAGAQLYGGAFNSGMRITELMT